MNLKIGKVDEIKVFYYFKRDIKGRIAQGMKAFLNKTNQVQNV